MRGPGPLAHGSVRKVEYLMADYLTCRDTVAGVLCKGEGLSHGACCDLLISHLAFLRS